MTPKTSTNASVRSFESIAKDYYEESFERFPTFGSAAGLRKYNDQLGHATPGVYADQTALARRTLGAIMDLPVHDFEGDAMLDRRTLRAHLIRELMFTGDLASWRTNPQTYLDEVAGGIHSLLIRNADDLRPVAAAVIARIRAVPRYLDEAAGCIRRPVPLWAKLTGQSAPGVVALFDSLPVPLAAATSHSEGAIRRWTSTAGKAVMKYAKRVAAKQPGPADGFCVGTERFETLIRERLGLNLTAREAAASAEGLIQSLLAELKTEARRFHPRKSAAEILSDAAAEWEPGGRDLLHAYEIQMREMKSRFRKASAMSFPKGDRLLVKLVPEFMKHQFPTAAYSSPGALDPDQTGIFWVNDLSLGRRTAEARRAEIAQHFGLELTSAHEAYPGHHLQFVTQHRHPGLARKLADHSIYYEGWTLWCEQMAVDLRVSDNPYLRLIQLHDALWRANRIVIDCGLQTGAMNYNQACRRLTEHVGFTRARAQGDVNWYTSSPTVPMSYLLGKMELLRLKRQRVDQGGWTLKRFNDWVLGFGAIPWSWIEASGL